MSKELDALGRIVGCSTIESHRPKWQEDYKIIETALEDYERLKVSYLENLLNEEAKEYLYDKLKALEIIRMKRVNVNLLRKSCKLVWNYNKNFCDKNRQLTQEEYELLKEVLL